METLDNLEQVLENHKLEISDYNIIKEILGREPNLLEIGIFSAMWSEHCSYKSSKIYLNGFPTKAPWVLQGPGENAGVIDIGGGYAAVFKMESHNHPSFIEPHAGAATGVGGIMRDVFTMGARLVASLNSIRFGNLQKDTPLAKKHRYLLRGVVSGIGDYGNCMGVPTVGGEMSFEECYNGNILVNAFALGIVKSNEIFYGRAEGVGNPVIYVGSKTGRDGLGGAVMSSNSFNQQSQKLRPTVQIGDPFTEKLLLEACLELFKKDVIIGIQDMGAAGLTSSSFEMAGRAGSGMILHLDKVPTRENAMTPYELMLSESQERMLICAKKGCENQVLEIFSKWELPCEIIGEVTNTGKMELFWKSEKCGEIPIAPLSENAPILRRKVADKPRYLESVGEFKLPNLSTKEIFYTLLNTPEILDKNWVYEQYDSTVQCNTLTLAGSGGASAIRVRENGKSLALSVFCNPRLCYLNPKEGAKQAVARVGRDCALRGATPLAITDCLNFGSPLNDEVMWQFRESCEGIKEAALTLNTPVVSGNVSLYNQTDKQDIYPTPSIACVGLLDGESVTPSFWQRSENLVVLLSGSLSAEFGGSLLVKTLENGSIKKAPLATINLQNERTLWDFFLSHKEIFYSSVDVGTGGLLMSLAKSCIRANVGFCFQKELSLKELFGECPTRVLVEIETRHLEMLTQKAKEVGLECLSLGVLGGEFLEWSSAKESVKIDLESIRKIFFEKFSQIIEQL